MDKMLYFIMFNIVALFLDLLLYVFFGLLNKYLNFKITNEHFVMSMIFFHPVFMTLAGILIKTIEEL